MRAAAVEPVSITSPLWYRTALAFGASSLAVMVALAVGIAGELGSAADGPWIVVLIGAPVVWLAGRGLLRIRWVEMSADGLHVSGGLLRHAEEVVRWDLVSAIAVVAARNSYAWRIDYRRGGETARITSPFGLGEGDGTAAPPRLTAVADAWSAASGPVAIRTVMGGWSAARVR